VAGGHCFDFVSDKKDIWPVKPVALVFTHSGLKQLKTGGGKPKPTQAYRENGRYRTFNSALNLLLTDITSS